ncbi:class II D-tagatose-bisphosphate aldolase, non-catalytic subunit, partial [Thermotoga sp.]|uniref:class II D-tagatose-bisphosphate aldolase non-catalytic subunit n=1 Tax=Thermotoga sp. TaxID=28240 RepID=UPI0025D29BAF
MTFLDFIKNAKSVGKGIFSVCTSNFDVIRIVMEFMKDKEGILLFESTSNQVNQEGGYTGLKPADFVRKLKDLASEIGINWNRIVLGGDHLGPLPWRNLAPEIAMENGKKMVQSYIRAGYRKIHLDTSFPLGNEENFSTEIAAMRQAQLCQAAEKAWREVGGEPPVYILGTEVPPAGGVVSGKEYIT